jgi:hypothetical protein
MNLITTGRIYGSIATLALLGVFVFQPQMDMPDELCGVLSFWQKDCIVGVQVLYRGTIVYCLLAGYLISRIVDRKPDVRKWAALITATGATCLLAMPLLIGFGLYYH